MREIQSEDQLTQTIEDSRTQPVFLFKHSTRCPISAGARRAVEAYIEHAKDAPPFHMINVVEARPVAMAAAERLGVEHQSPQLILLKDGAPAWQASHGTITEAAVENALRSNA